jgi:hypothetical protein
MFEAKPLLKEAQKTLLTFLEKLTISSVSGSDLSCNCFSFWFNHILAKILITFQEGNLQD